LSKKGKIMSKKKLGLALFAIGLLVLILSLAADALGLGTGGGIGWKQWLGAGLGAGMEITGVWLALRGNTTQTPKTHTDF
jgi:hypothetical protein